MRSPLRRAAIAATATICLTAPAAAAADPASNPTGRWSFWGEKGVSATERVGDRLYVGGDFRFASYATGPAAVFAPASGSAERGRDLLSRRWAGASSPQDPARVTAVVSDGDGGYYAAGVFDAVGTGRHQESVVHVRADGTTDPGFRGVKVSGPGGRVTDLALRGDVLYVGGQFTKAGGGDRTSLAAVDADTGALEPFDAKLTSPSGTPSVSALHAGADGLYVGGTFGAAGGETRQSLARIDYTSAKPDTFDPGVTGGAVEALDVLNGVVYVGGRFTAIDETPRQRLAAVSAATGALVPAFNPAAVGANVTDVDAVDLAGDGPRVYVVGEFSQIGGGTRANVAALNPASGAVVPAFAPTVSDPPDAVLATADGVYLGGGFGETASNAEFGRLSRVSRATGALQSTFEAGILTGGVDDLAVLEGGGIVAGGSFQFVNAVSRAGLAAIDLDDESLTAWDPGLSSGTSVFDFEAQGDRLYLGGDFSDVAGEPRPHLAAFDLPSGDLVADFEPAPDNYVYALAAKADGTLFAGGAFWTIGENAAPRKTLAALDADGDATAWTADTDDAGSVLDVTLSADGSRLYAAGMFTQLGGQARNGLAAVTTAATATVEGWNPAPARPAQDAAWATSVAVDGDRVLVAGRFSQIGGQSRDNIAAVSAAGGQAVAAWDAGDREETAYEVAVGPDGDVYAIGDTAVTSYDGVTGQRTRWTPTGYVVPPTVSTYASHVLSFGAAGEVFAGAGAANQISLVAGAPAQGLVAFRAAQQPAWAAAPRVDGEPLVPKQLTCDAGDPAGSAPFAISYTWLRDGQAIAGADDATYTLTNDDAAAKVACRATAENAAGSSTSTTSETVTVVVGKPENDLAPEVVGDATVGQSVECTTGAWRNAPTAYARQWLADGAEIGGATGATLALTAAQQGKRVSCRVTATNFVGPGAATSSAVTVKAAKVDDPPQPPPPGPPGPPANPGGQTPAPGPGPKPQPQPQPQPQPRTTVEISSATKISGSRVAFQLTVPKAGRLTVTVKASRKVGAVRKGATLATGTVTVRRAGKVVVQLKLTKAGRAAVKRKGRRVPASVNARLTPTGGGSAATSTASITLRR